MIPKKKSHELLSEVIGTSLVERRNPFVLNKYTSAAKTLLSLDSENAYFGYIVLGILSCIKGEVDDMRRFHERAITLFPMETLGLRNYARSLMTTGYFEEAEKSVLQAYKINESENVSYVVDTYLFSGRFRLASSWYDRCVSQSSSAVAEIRANMMDFIRDVVMRKWSDKGERASVAMVDAVYNHLHSAGLYYTEGKVALLSDEYGQWIDYEISVDLNPADIVEHSLEIGARLDELDIPREVRSLFVPRLTNGV